jgi:hypothetical protein
VDVGRLGRRVRVGFTLTLAALVFYGTLWGDDEDFPVGPFRMYSTSRELNEPVYDTQMYAVNAAGEEFRFVEGLTGVRRAEIEGQMDLIKDDPTRLRYLAEAYENRYPSRPEVVEVRIVIEWSEIDDGVPTGESYVEEVATWRK